MLVVSLKKVYKIGEKLKAFTYLNWEAQFQKKRGLSSCIFPKCEATVVLSTAVVVPASAVSTRAHASLLSCLSALAVRRPPSAPLDGSASLFAPVPKEVFPPPLANLKVKLEYFGTEFQGGEENKTKQRRRVRRAQNRIPGESEMVLLAQLWSLAGFCSPRLSRVSSAHAWDGLRRSAQVDSCKNDLWLRVEFLEPIQFSIWRLLLLNLFSHSYLCASVCTVSAFPHERKGRRSPYSQ